MVESKMEANMRMKVWKGNWGLPSIDTRCLYLMAFAKFSGAPIKLENDFDIWSNLKGNFPILISDEMIMEGKNKIIEHLRTKGFDSDRDLTDIQRADILAFDALLEDKLLPALLHVYWIDAKNYVDVFRPVYANFLSFPFNFITPGKWQRYNQERVETMFGGPHLVEGELKEIIFKKAKKCLNLLSERLHDKDFFFGDMPTSLDAAVFGYLAPLLRAPLPSTELQAHLKACDNLCRLVSRIQMRYFPDIPSDESQKNKPNENSTTEPYEEEHKRRNQILSVLFAAAMMVGYAVFSGLVKVQVDDGGFGMEVDYNDEEKDEEVD
ncbi:metaxin-1-like isoform X2 [Anneissia japonica]|uniref:metaxin-1-like isoform X2 n=1 Tax=Anneissia japonica TaxID=1529436 RepID=UPI0014254E2E|nr:metaxin-1-like isoform X2 [Anneissia japonica]